MHIAPCVLAIIYERDFVPQNGITKNDEVSLGSEM
jgi:hypothetical protein